MQPALRGVHRGSRRGARSVPRVVYRDVDVHAPRGSEPRGHEARYAPLQRLEEVHRGCEFTGERRRDGRRGGRVILERGREPRRLRQRLRDGLDHLRDPRAGILSLTAQDLRRGFPGAELDGAVLLGDEPSEFLLRGFAPFLRRRRVPRGVRLGFSLGGGGPRGARSRGCQRGSNRALHDGRGAPREHRGSRGGRGR